MVVKPDSMSSKIKREQNSVWSGNFHLFRLGETLPLHQRNSNRRCLQFGLKFVNPKSKLFGQQPAAFHQLELHDIIDCHESFLGLECSVGNEHVHYDFFGEFALHAHFRQLAKNLLTARTN